MVSGITKIAMMPHRRRGHISSLFIPFLSRLVIDNTLVDIPEDERASVLLDPSAQTP